MMFVIVPLILLAYTLPECYHSRVFKAYMDGPKKCVKLDTLLIACSLRRVSNT